MPLKIGDKWEYAASSGSNTFTEEVLSTITFGGKSYFRIKYFSPPSNNMDYYYRMDAAGDIYKYLDVDLAEYLDIPFNPTNGQVIATYVSGAKRKVTGLNQSITTPSCSYTGLVKIEDLSSAGTTTATYYYKKGLGLIESVSAETMNLKVVTFK